MLNFIASTLKSVDHSNLYADLPGYVSPSVLTGDELRPDLLITLENKCIYVLELTIGFESNLLTNVTQKQQKYQDLINEQHKNYEKVKFINLSIHWEFSVTLRWILLKCLMILSLMNSTESTVFGKLLTYVSGPHIIFFASVIKNGIILK